LDPLGNSSQTLKAAAPIITIRKVRIMLEESAVLNFSKKLEVMKASVDDGETLIEKHQYQISALISKGYTYQDIYIALKECGIKIGKAKVKKLVSEYEVMVLED
jgi:hypothetical protein